MALVTLVAGGALAACGSASSSSTTSSTTASASSGSGSGSSTTGGGSATGPNSARRAQLVSCLKAHGVTLPTRPAGSPPPGGAGGGTGTGTTGTGTTPRRGFFGGGGARNISPKMQAAFKACGAQSGFGRGGGAFGGRLSHTAITGFVTCVNQHGYKLPAPNFSGKGPIFPRSIETNAKFQAAAKSCQHLLIPARPGGGSGGGTSTTSGA